MNKGPYRDGDREKHLPETDIASETRRILSSYRETKMMPRIIHEINMEYRCATFGKTNPHVRRSMGRDDFETEFKAKYGFSCSFQTAEDVYVNLATEGCISPGLLERLGLN